MSSNLRATQVVVEILQAVDNPQLRTTQLVAELLHAVDNPQLRTTQIVVEALFTSVPKPSVTREKLGPRIQSV